MAQAAPSEVLFERASVKVTGTRFDTGALSFPIRKIDRVKVSTERTSRRTGIAFLVGGVAALLGGGLSNLPVLIVAGAALIVSGAMMCFAKVRRSVVLTTRGHEVRALTSKDAKLIQSVVTALEDAIARRG